MNQYGVFVNPENSKRRVYKALAVIHLHQIQSMVYDASLIHPTQAVVK